MVKKLTEKEIRDREVKKVVCKIQNLEKTHAKDIVESACFKYKSANLERRNAEKAIKNAEEKLEEAKRKLK